MWILYLALIALAPIAVFAETIAPGETLTLSRAIEVGLKNHPSVMAGTSTIRVNEAKVGEARAAYYPQVNLTEAYSRIGRPNSTSESNTTVGNGTAAGLPSGTTGATTNRNSVDQYTSSANLSQTLYDFGKTSSQVKIQTLNVDAARSDLENTRDQVVYNVKQAYLNLLQATRNRDVARETVKQFQEHLRQARGFYGVGKSPRFDVTKAEVDLSNAEVNLIKAENQVRLARVTLNNTMGLPQAPDYTIAENLSFAKYELSFDDALRKAYAQRSDMISLVKKREAADESIRLAQKGYMPTLSGSASYYYTGNSFPLDNGWTLGANLTFPLFSGFLTKYQVLEAKSTKDTFIANELALKQDILLQVQLGYLNLREAGERITATELAVRQGSENLELATGRYQAGVGSPIEVTDSVVALNNAEVSYAQALYDYRISAASIERAIGAR